MPGIFLPAEHTALKVPHVHWRELHLEELLLASRDGTAAGLDREQWAGTDCIQRRAQGGRDLLQSVAQLARTTAGLELHRGTRSGREEISCGKEEIIAGHPSRRKPFVPSNSACYCRRTKGSCDTLEASLAKYFQQENSQ